MSAQIYFSRRRVLAAGAMSALAAVLARYTSAARAVEQAPGSRGMHAGIAGVIVFDFQRVSAQTVHPRRVVQHLIVGGSAVLETTRSYADAKQRVGKLVAELALQDQIYVATRFLSDADLASGGKALRTLKVSEPCRDAAPLDAWTLQGHCSYVGVATSSDRRYSILPRLLEGAADAAGNALLSTADDAGAALLVDARRTRGSAGGGLSGEAAADFIPGAGRSMLDYAAVGAVKLVRAACAKKVIEPGWSLVATTVE